MQEFFQSRRRSFKYAFEGLGYVLKTQPNSWIHLLATVIVVLLSVWLILPLHELAMLVLVIGLVWIVECINTSIEAIVDHLSPQPHEAAKVAKDVGAGAVLVAAILSIVVGLLILGPPLLDRLQD